MTHCPRKPRQPITDFQRALDATTEIFLVVEDARKTTTKRHPRLLYAARDLSEALSRWDAALQEDARHPNRIDTRIRDHKTALAERAGKPHI